MNILEAPSSYSQIKTKKLTETRVQQEWKGCSCYQKYKSKAVLSHKYFWLEQLSVGWSSKSATCSMTEVNESPKSCENAPLNLEDCCAVNLYICAELSWCRWSMMSSHHVLRGLIPVQFFDGGDTLVENCWLLLCLWWAQWCSVNHDCHRWIFSAGKAEHVRAIGCWWWWVGVHVFCWSGTTVSEGWLPVMAAGPADRKSLALILEARPKSLLLLLLRTVRSSASQDSCCTKNELFFKIWSFLPCDFYNIFFGRFLKI